MNDLLILSICFVVLTVMGVPLFAAVGLTTALALFLIDIPFTLLAQTGYSSLTPFPLLTIPLFVLAGRLMETGGMANRMIGIAIKLVGAYRGSMGLVTVFACMLFGALSGSGPATTAAIGSATVPAMKNDGYDVPFAAAITASAGALGSLIPPSNLLIIYGLVSETSIPRLFPGRHRSRHHRHIAVDDHDLHHCPPTRLWRQRRTVHMASVSGGAMGRKMVHRRTRC